MINSKYGALTVRRKSGDEPFTANGLPIGKNLLEFWQWSNSDLVGNALRGVIAEYLVTTAVGSESATRTEWDAFDVITSNGVRVEVKSGAYLQTWAQSSLSNIQFSIKPTYGWDSATNTVAGSQSRQADVYVFCVLAHKEKSTVNPLDLDQWEFYVLSTEVLNAELGKQKSINLSSLLRFHPVNAAYHELSDVINAVATG